MKKAIISGAAGFTGISLVKDLKQHGYEIYAIVRPGSLNNRCIEGIDDIHILEIDMLADYDLSNFIHENCDVAFHLACVGERNDFNTQLLNVSMTIRFMEELYKIGCRRIVITGSQAEYGATSEIVTESTVLSPFCAYGAAKVATCYLSKNKAESLGMEWIWARIFSLYGENEPESRMIPSLIRELKAGNDFNLSSCKQNWDYLNVRDGAEALIALAENGKSGEIYNVANGEYKALKSFVETVKELIGSEGSVIYGDNPTPFVSLQPDVTKIKLDTGWEAKISFAEGINKLLKGKS